MNALTLPPPLPADAGQADFVSAVAQLESLAAALGSRAHEAGLELTARPGRTADVLQDESSLRAYCADALRRFPTASATTSVTPIRPATITQRALASRTELRRADARAALAREQGPSGPLVVVANLTEAARRRLAGENVVHRSAAPRAEMTITEQCREVLRKRRESAAAV